MKQFNTAVIIYQPKVSTDALDLLKGEKDYTTAREVLQELVLDCGVIETSVQLIPMLDFMDMFNNEEITTSNTFIGFVNLTEEVA